MPSLPSVARCDISGNAARITVVSQEDKAPWVAIGEIQGTAQAVPYLLWRHLRSVPISIR